MFYDYWYDIIKGGSKLVRIITHSYHLRKKVKFISTYICVNFTFFILKILNCFKNMIESIFTKYIIYYIIYKNLSRIDNVMFRLLVNYEMLNTIRKKNCISLGKHIILKIVYNFRTFQYPINRSKIIVINRK